MFLFPKGPDHNECKWRSGESCFFTFLLGVMFYLSICFLCAFDDENFQTFIGCFGYIKNKRFI